MPANTRFGQFLESHSRLGNPSLGRGLAAPYLGIASLARKSLPILGVSSVAGLFSLTGSPLLAGLAGAVATHFVERGGRRGGGGAAGTKQQKEFIKTAQGTQKTLDTIAGSVQRIESMVTLMAAVTHHRSYIKNQREPNPQETVLGKLLGKLITAIDRSLDFNIKRLRNSRQLVERRTKERASAEEAEESSDSSLVSKAAAVAAASGKGGRGGGLLGLLSAPLLGIAGSAIGIISGIMGAIIPIVLGAVGLLGGVGAAREIFNVFKGGDASISKVISSGLMGIIKGLTLWSVDASKIQPMVDSLGNAAENVIGHAENLLNTIGEYLGKIPWQEMTDVFVEKFKTVYIPWLTENASFYMKEIEKSSKEGLLSTLWDIIPGTHLGKSVIIGATAAMGPKTTDEAESLNNATAKINVEDKISLNSAIEQTRKVSANAKDEKTKREKEFETQRLEGFQEIFDLVEKRHGRLPYHLMQLRQNLIQNPAYKLTDFEKKHFNEIATATLKRKQQEESIKAAYSNRTWGNPMLHVQNPTAYQGNAPRTTIDNQKTTINISNTNNTGATLIGTTNPRGGWMGPGYAPGGYSPAH